MKLYTKKVTDILAEQWKGAEDEDVITTLRMLGYRVVFQEPRNEEDEEWDEETKETVKVPAKGLLVAVSPWNWELTYVEPGEYVRLRFYVDGDSAVAIGPEDVPAAVQAVRERRLNVEVSTVKAFSMAKDFNL